ncbi:MAG: hypothetical protein K2M56_02140, partial [Muribaculaceae bacterium]|nr:hypothetical protein [Muribaculaceae bacterium]
QDSNLHASQHSHLKRARLPFRHLGISGFGFAKLRRIFEFCKFFDGFFSVGFYFSFGALFRG